MFITQVLRNCQGSIQKCAKIASYLRSFSGPCFFLFLFYLLSLYCVIVMPFSPMFSACYNKKYFSEFTHHPDPSTSESDFLSDSIMKKVFLRLRPVPYGSGLRSGQICIFIYQWVVKGCFCC